MRNARVQDYWSKVYKRSYDKSFVSMDLNGLNSIKQILASSGIWAICGLNGAGKSTVIAAIKDVLGLPLSKYDTFKIGDANIQAVVAQDKKEINCSNQSGHRFVDQGGSLEMVCYLDSALNTDVQDFLIRQENLDELLEQYEEYELSDEETKQLNEIVGKRYQSCSVKMLDDIDDSKSIPYCKMCVDNTVYDSRSMGVGEHFLLYLFLQIKEMKKGGMLIIEEPETYISISAQQSLMNYLAKQIAEKGITVILTTHSPYILKRIRNENIRVINRIKNMVKVVIPMESYTAETMLGMQPLNKGTIFVEDRVAADFLSVCLEDCSPNILREYTIDIVSGESGISERLKFPKSDNIHYNFIGVYDGDMRGSLSEADLQWGFCFLPGDKPLEVLFQDFVTNEEGIAALSQCLQVDESILFAKLATLEGVDYHDWFDELRKLLGVDGKQLIRAFYSLMKEYVLDVESFLDELNSKLS